MSLKTLRKLAENAMPADEHKYKNLMKAVADMFCDRSMALKYASAEGKELDVKTLVAIMEPLHELWMKYDEQKD